MLVQNQFFASGQGVKLKFMAHLPGLIVNTLHHMPDNSC
jgi:hypothetical protein